MLLLFLLFLFFGIEGKVLKLWKLMLIFVVRIIKQRFVIVPTQPGQQLSKKNRKYQLLYAYGVPPDDEL